MSVVSSFNWIQWFSWKINPKQYINILLGEDAAAICSGGFWYLQGVREGGVAVHHWGNWLIFVSCCCTSSNHCNWTVQTMCSVSCSLLLHISRYTYDCQGELITLIPMFALLLCLLALRRQFDWTQTTELYFNALCCNETPLKLCRSDFQCWMQLVHFSPLHCTTVSQMFASCKVAVQL